MAMFKCQGESLATGTYLNQYHNVFNNSLVTPNQSRAFTYSFTLPRKAKKLTITVSGQIGSTGYNALDQLRVGAFFSGSSIGSKGPWNHAALGYGKNSFTISKTLDDIAPGTYSVTVRFTNDVYPNADGIGIYEDTVPGANWNGSATHITVVASK